MSPFASDRRCMSMTGGGETRRGSRFPTGKTAYAGSVKPEARALAALSGDGAPRTQLYYLAASCRNRRKAI